MKKINKFGKLLLCFTLLFVTSCSNSKKRKELEDFVKKVKSRQITEIEPLPEVKPYERFTYKDTNMRSPFLPCLPLEVLNATNEKGIRPDTSRRKEPLEAFPLDDLRMMGTLEKNGKKWAIVVDTDRSVHRITKGNYVGQHDGRIDEITEEKILITQVILSPSGGWQKRKASLTLANKLEKPKKGE